MRILEIFIFFCCFSMMLGVNAQQTSFIMELPEEGDVFYYKLDNLPDNVLPSIQGHRNVWNLSMLSAPTAHEYSFKRALSGEYSNFFPQADLVSIDVWKNERYYAKFGSGLFLIGEVLRSKADITSNVHILKYTDPKPMFNQRYNLGESQSYEAKWEVVLNGGEVDSYSGDSNDLIKIEVTEEIQEDITKSGIVFLPRERYNSAFQLERSITSQIRIYLKKGDSNWAEMEQLLPTDDLPFSISNHKEILFMTEEKKEWLANLSIDSHGHVQNVLFKSAKEQVRSTHVYDNKSFFLYPNPSFGLVRLDFVNLPKGVYDLELYNIIGKRIWSKSYDVMGYTTIKEDLGFLSKGTYLYSIVDKSGKKLLTRKMAIINP